MSISNVLQVICVLVVWMGKVIIGATKLLRDSLQGTLSGTAIDTLTPAATPRAVIASTSTPSRISVFDLPTDVLLLVYDSLPFADLITLDKGTTNRHFRPR